MALRKQPRRRLIDALVVPQLLEEPAREQRVPILSPLALLDADEHPLGVDVRVPQAHDLAQAEAAGVRRHQQDAVLEVATLANNRATSSRLRISGNFCAPFGSGTVKAARARPRVIS